VLDFADFGNSPDNFTAGRIRGRTIVYSTTNGTQAIQMAGRGHQVLVGGFLKARSPAFPHFFPVSMQPALSPQQCPWFRLNL